MDEQIRGSGQINMGDLYTYNKMLFLNKKPLTDEEIDQSIQDITKNFNFKKYAMLLCRERYDYTTFINKHNLNSPMALALNTVEILDNRGKILDISKNEDTNYFECWIIPHGEEDPVMYLLFDAEGFVIKC